MLLPLSSLRSFLDFEIDAEEIAERLTQNGIEVEEIEHFDPPFKGVVCAQVVQTKAHPQADRLCIAIVDDGKETHQVVCGAKNCREGLKTAFAKVGASLFDEKGEFKIKLAKLRGLESFGMLCSEKELGLSEEDEGIIELDDAFNIGDDLYSQFKESIFHVSLTPNLGHCSSVLGLARELSASLNIPLKPQHFILEESSDNKTKDLVSIDIQNPEDCPRYACRAVKDVSVKPSPFSIKRKLHNFGLRSINNVVDISNLVLMEYGHPLHTFDFEKIKGQKIIVRTAKPSESFVTLDEREHQLNQDTLLICDAERPIALAGIMGGLNSEVGKTSHDVLIESAYFCPKNIRKSSKALKIQSESSKRFERGCDPIGLEDALDYAAFLIQKYAGGKITKGRLNLQTCEFKRKTISLRPKRINQILGLHLALGEVESILKRLDLESTLEEDQLLVKIPSYRHDLKQEIDLIEEVARIYGYHNIEVKKALFSNSSISHSPIYLFEQKLRDAVLAEGLQELLSCNLIGPSQIEEIFGKIDIPIIEVLKPSSVEQSILRPSLLPGIVQILKYNQEHQNKDMRAFEIGKIHFKEKEQYIEQTALAIVLSGNTNPYHYELKSSVCDFFQLKGILENVFKSCACKDFSLQKSSFDHLHPGRQASISVGDLQIGSIGELHPSLLRKYQIPSRSYFAQININLMMQCKSESEKIQDICPFPGSERDLTLTVAENTALKEILDRFEKSESKLLQKVSLLDIYRGSQVGENQKNLTLRFFYQDRDKTLDHEAVEKEHQRIVNFVGSF